MLYTKKSDFTVCKFKKDERPKVKKPKNAMVLRPKKVLLRVLGYKFSASFCPYAVHIPKTVFIIVSLTQGILNSSGEVVSNSEVF